MPVTSESVDDRFEFGQNWKNFIENNFSQERCDVAKQHILSFLGRENLEGLDFLDVGCGSGLHSLGAFQAGAGRIHSLDYDENSVSTTKILRKYAELPENWKVERGDALNKEYIDGLGKWNFVYSWGVLHHTGDVWSAIRNVQAATANGGLFYLALYAEDVQTDPQYWLDVKQKYNRSGPWMQKLMVLDYIWRFGMDRKLRNIPRVLSRIREYRQERGMNYFADIRDWIGGWPMEFTKDQEVVDLLEQEYGFKLINVSTGEACSEYLFERSGTPEKPTNVVEMVERLKAG